MRLRVRAIRGAWAIARRAGIAHPVSSLVFDSIMDRDAAVRLAVINAWLAGYGHGRRDARSALSRDGD